MHWKYPDFPCWMISNQSDPCKNLPSCPNKGRHDWNHNVRISWFRQQTKSCILGSACLKERYLQYQAKKKNKKNSLVTIWWLLYIFSILRSFLLGFLKSMGASVSQRTQWGRDHWATPTLEASLPENLEAEPSAEPSKMSQIQKLREGTVEPPQLFNGYFRWKCPCLDYQVHQRSMNKKHVTAYIYIYTYDAASYLWTKIVANKRTILSKTSPSRKNYSPWPFGMASCPRETWLKWHLMVVFWASQNNLSF